ncbi:Protein of unknown function [Bacillus mycoides]|nr:Protein of unknown function [Bacillus mycoides]
MFAAANMGYT